MRKEVLIILGVFSLAFKVHATQSVIDHTAIAQSAAQEVVNLAKYVTTATKQSETAVNTLNQYESMVTYLARFGNPGALRNLPVVGSIAELYGDGQRLIQDYQRIRAMTDPSRLQGQLSSVIGAYGLQQWNPIAPGAYQFPVANYQVSQTVQDRIDDLEKERQRLEKKRDDLLQSLQTDTDQSAVQKHSAALTGVNGALSEIAARSSELAQRSALQQQQLAAGREVQRQQLTEMTGTSFSGGINSDMDALNQLAPDYTNVQHLLAQ